MPEIPGLPSIPKLDRPDFQLPHGHKLEKEFQRPYSLYSVDPSPANADALLSVARPAIEQGLKIHGGKSVNPMLRSRAKQIALDAARTYDPTKAAFKTHLINSLQGLKRYSIKQQQVVSVPEGVATDHLHLTEAEAQLRDELGRDPSDVEIGDRAGISAKRIGYVRRYRPGFAEGQAQMLMPGDEEGGPADIGIRGGDNFHERLEFLYPDLDPINQAIVDHQFGRNGRPKLGVTAIARNLHLTPGAISQRTANIQAMINELGDAEVF